MACTNAFYAQSGGVSAVINASACGVLQTSRQYPERIGKVYAGRNGIIGALTEDLIDTSVESEAAIAALKHTPGAAFGSCRYKLGLIDQHRAQYERLMEGHCQLNGRRNGSRLDYRMQRGSCRRLDASLLTPNPKRLGASAPVAGGGEKVAPWSKVFVDHAVRRKEILRLFG
jgi:hypothetical protein